MEPNLLKKIYITQAKYVVKPKYTSSQDKTIS